MIDQSGSVVRYIQRLISHKPRKVITRNPFIRLDGRSPNYHRIKDKDVAIYNLEEKVEVLQNRLQYAIAELAEAYDSLKPIGARHEGQLQRIKKLVQEYADTQEDLDIDKVVAEIDKLYTVKEVANV